MVVCILALLKVENGVKNHKSNQPKPAYGGSINYTLVTCANKHLFSQFY